MSAERCFFDTNAIAYFASPDADKARQAKHLLGFGGTISVQVLNELTLVMRRKFAMSWLEVHEILNIIKTVLDVVPVTLSVHEEGIRLAERYKLSVYDAMIVAAAIETNCDVLWSEDMQHGMKIGGLEIRNPFAA